MALPEFTSPNLQNTQSTGPAISVAPKESSIGPVKVAQTTPIITDTPAIDTPATDAPATDAPGRPPLSGPV